MHGKNYHDASGKVTSPVAIATALPLQKKFKEKQGRCPHPLSRPPSTSRSVSLLSNHLHHHLHQNSFPSFAITRTRPFIASEVPCSSASRRYHSGSLFLHFFAFRISSNFRTLHIRCIRFTVAASFDRVPACSFSHSLLHFSQARIAKHDKPPPLHGRKHVETDQTALWAYRKYFLQQDSPVK